MDKDLYELPPRGEGDGQAAARARSTRCSTTWRSDHDFLLKGDVFTQDVIETWIEYKRKNEVDAVRLRPHPYEFALYYDL